jgi:hypothetical protein
MVDGKCLVRSAAQSRENHRHAYLDYLKCHL